MSETSASPYAAFAEHCRRGELAYQVRISDGRPVFPPRMVAPETAGPLEWRVSAGRGRVYATTMIHRKGETPYNVALVDLDEGFRMMSRVEGVPADRVEIGTRVRFEVRRGEEDEPVAVFVREES